MIEDLEAKLQNPKDKVRARAAFQLGRSGNARAFDPLLLALRDPSAKVRRRAACALGDLGDSRAVSALIAALEDPDEEVPGCAANALARIGGADAVAALIRVLDHSSYQVRHKATKALIKIGPPAVEALLSAYPDLGDEGRAHALEALGRIGDERAADLFVSALSDSSDSVCWVAAAIQRQVRDPRAVKPLLVALNDPQRALGAICTLGEIGDPRAVEPLIAIACDRHKANLRWRAIWALGRLRDSRAVEPLLSIVRAKGARRGLARHALWVLGKIGDRRAIKALLAVLGSKDVEMSGAAAYALADIGDASVVKHLVQFAVRYPPYRYRSYVDAISHLGETGDRRTLAQLKRFARSKILARQASGHILYHIQEAIDGIRQRLL